MYSYLIKYCNLKKCTKKLVNAEHIRALHLHKDINYMIDDLSANCEKAGYPCNDLKAGYERFQLKRMHLVSERHKVIHRYAVNELELAE